MKLHPLSIPFRIVETVFQFLWVVLLGGFAAVTATSGALTVVVIGAAIIGLVIIITAWQIAYYRRYEFSLTPDTFDIVAGVFSRRDREIPYRRIQNIAINQDVFQRLFGLAELRIETAGGGSTEVQLRYVNAEVADELQDELSQRKRQADRSSPAPAESTAPATETENDSSPAQNVFELTTRELVVLGLASLDSRWFVLVIIGISAFFPQLGGQLLDGGVLAVPATVVGLYLVIAVISTIYAVTNYYGFTLLQDDQELRYERGLLQRYSGTIPLAKIQALTIAENVITRSLGYASLMVETAGFSPGETGSTRSAVPIAKRSRVETLLHRIEPVDIGGFARPPTRARRRYIARYTGLVLLLAGIAYGGVWLTSMEYPWYLTLGGVLIAPLAAHLKWRHRGYAITDGYVITRNGFWRRTTKIVPLHRVQVVFDSQTIFQRRWGLATLTVDTAGSQSLINDNSKAVDIDATTAARLRETITDRFFDDLDRQRQQREASTGSPPVSPKPAE